MIGSENSMSTNERDEFRDWLNKLMKDLRRIKKDIAKNGWAVEDIEARIEERARMEREAGRSRSRDAGRPRRQRANTARESNVRYVKKGVSSVLIQHDPDGWMIAQIENIGLPVLLKSSQRLRELLVALCGKVSRRNGPDAGVVPFKTSAELIEAIKRISGEQISLSNLQNLVQHLRDLLSEAQVNPDLVETGGGGYRLRLRMDGRLHEEVS